MRIKWSKLNGFVMTKIIWHNQTPWLTRNILVSIRISRNDLFILGFVIVNFQSRFGSCSNPLNLRLGGRGNKIEFRKSSSLSMEISAPRRDQRTSSHGFRDSSSVDTEAIESLLLLGREPILSPQTIKVRSRSNQVVKNNTCHIINIKVLSRSFIFISQRTSRHL